MWLKDKKIKKAKKEKVPYSSTDTNDMRDIFTELYIDTQHRGTGKSVD